MWYSLLSSCSPPSLNFSWGLFGGPCCPCALHPQPLTPSSPPVEVLRARSVPLALSLDGSKPSKAILVLVGTTCSWLPFPAPGLVPILPQHSFPFPQQPLAPLLSPHPPLPKRSLAVFALLHSHSGPLPALWARATGCASFLSHSVLTTAVACLGVVYIIVTSLHPECPSLLLFTTQITGIGIMLE